MVRVPVDNGNANSSYPSFKVTIVDMAQFRSLLRLSLTILIVVLMLILSFHHHLLEVVSSQEGINDDTHCDNACLIF